MIELWVSIAVFTLFHMLPSTRWRAALIGRLGRGRFMLVFSLISLLLMGWMFFAFWRAEYDHVWWVSGQVFRIFTAGMMLLAFLLAFTSMFQRPALLLTGERVLSRPGSLRGVLRITRHPVLWATAIWSALHMANNFDPAGLSLFGYFLLLSLAGTRLIDRRRKRLLEEMRWKTLRADTSNLPFLAILQSRNRLRPLLWEAGWLGPLLGLIFWGLILVFHGQLFGMPVFS